MAEVEDVPGGARGERRIAVDIELSGWQEQLVLTMTSEEGVSVTHTLDGEFAEATQAEKALANLRDGVAKLGQTLYYSRNVEINLPGALFVPNSLLNQLRRETAEMLDDARLKAVVRGSRLVYGAALAPHCPLGPVALAACLHVDFVSYNAVFQEQSMGIHYNKGAELLDFVKNKDDFNMEGGFFKPLMKPGLGVEIDEARVIELSQNAPDWRNPLWRHEDGSVAEW